MSEKKLRDEKLKKVEKEMKELIVDEIKKTKLKKMQCEGGRNRWIGERKVSMIITHLLMRKQNMDFGEANRLSWQFVKEERCKPCNLPKEDLDEKPAEDTIVAEDKLETRD